MRYSFDGAQHHNATCDEDSHLIAYDSPESMSAATVNGRIRDGTLTVAVRGLGLADGCKDIYGDSQLYNRTGVETIVSVPKRNAKDNKLNELVYVKAGTVVAVLEID